ncbi:hypothetical protein BKA93DRAFT_831077 [Sparassis latifolia]
MRPIVKHKLRSKLKPATKAADAIQPPQIAEAGPSTTIPNKRKIRPAEDLNQPPEDVEAGPSNRPAKRTKTHSDRETRPPPVIVEAKPPNSPSPMKTRSGRIVRAPVDKPAHIQSATVRRGRGRPRKEKATQVRDTNDVSTATTDPRASTSKAVLPPSTPPKATSSTSMALPEPNTATEDVRHIAPRFRRPTPKGGAPSAAPRHAPEVAPQVAVQPPTQAATQAAPQPAPQAGPHIAPVLGRPIVRALPPPRNIGGHTPTPLPVAASSRLRRTESFTMLDVGPAPISQPQAVAPSHSTVVNASKARPPQTHANSNALTQGMAILPQVSPPSPPQKPMRHLAVDASDTSNPSVQIYNALMRADKKKEDRVQQETKTSVGPVPPSQQDGRTVQPPALPVPSPLASYKGKGRADDVGIRARGASLPPADRAVEEDDGKGEKRRRESEEDEADAGAQRGAPRPRTELFQGVTRTGPFKLVLTVKRPAQSERVDFCG